LNVNVFVNKKNSQWSVSIPKKKLKNYLDHSNYEHNKHNHTNNTIQDNNTKEAPKQISIRLFKWWK
jgi:hypothetical protein